VVAYERRSIGRPLSLTAPGLCCDSLPTLPVGSTRESANQELDEPLGMKATGKLCVRVYLGPGANPRRKNTVGIPYQLQVSA
jgi:hypothetical protein